MREQVFWNLYRSNGSKTHLVGVFIGYGTVKAFRDALRDVDGEKYGNTYDIKRERLDTDMEEQK